MMGEEIVEKMFQNERQEYGRNLLLNSGVAIKDSTDYLINKYKLATKDLKPNEVVTISIKAKLEETRDGFRFYNSSGEGSAVMGFIGRDDFNESGCSFKTLKWRVSGANDELWIYQYPNNGSAGTTIEWIKLEKGNKATSWSPAPEDLIDSLKPQTYPLTII